MDTQDVQLQDSLRSLDATDDLQALPTDPSLTSRLSSSDFEAAAAVAAANAASGSQPFDVGAVANNTSIHQSHQSPVAGHA
ncbi:hypothetical protein ACJ72_08847, partial [Emergomyces africanus]